MRKLPFFLPFGGCSGRCVYCDQRTITGASAPITPAEVASALSKLGEPREVCFFGGSFCRFGMESVQGYLDAVKNFAPTGSRIRFSTYPGDLSDPTMLELVTSYDIACVELGIPSLDPPVLRACAREADPDRILSGLADLCDRSVSLGVQLMIGLPGQSPESSLRDIRRLAAVKGPLDWDLRVYPTLVLEGTALFDMMIGGGYAPLSLQEAIEWGGMLLYAATSLGFRPIRVGLQESPRLAAQVRGGPHHPALGELIAAESLARRLTSSNRHGPWTVPRRHMSKLTGHHCFGMKRLSWHSSLPEPDVATMIDFFPAHEAGRPL